MLHQLITQLSEAEREAVGVAAVATYRDAVATQRADVLQPVTLSTQEEVLAPSEKVNVRLPQMQDGYQDNAWVRLLNALCPLIHPRAPRREREEIVMAPSHSMISMSRLSSTRTALFDHMGMTMHPIAVRLHRARDFDEKDRLDPSMMRMEDEQLLEVLMSSSQYARLIRCDQSFTPCTLTRRHWMGHDFERNPHFDEQFDSRDIEQEAREVLADEIAVFEALVNVLDGGITRKADREDAEARITEMLAQMDATGEKLHQLADSARGQAGDAAKTRHSNLLSREVEALPASMRDHLKQLSDAGHPVARLLTADPHDD